MSGMNLYTREQCEQIESHKFAFLEIRIDDHVLTITLDREDKKNALHPQMVNEIAYAMHFAHFEKGIWVVVIAAKGNIFCAGADLKAMMGIIEPNDSTIPAPEGGEVLIGELFNKIYKPTIAKVTGDVYAGGFFFLAGSHITLAQTNVKFGLPEVKRGLYPFQVMAALLKVMPSRKVIDWCIRGYNLSVEEAQKFGLVSESCTPEEIDQRLQEIVDEIKTNSPSAIRLGLEAYDKIQPQAAEQKYLYDMLQKTIATKDGMEGLSAFRQKRKPLWTGE
jgi:enoyl-CoA hydratase/carnithine racemase